MFQELVLLLLVLLVFVAILHIEGFQNLEGTRFRCPTRNMSYDLRGDVPIVRQDVGPLQNTTIGPEDPSGCVYRNSVFM